jgi:hypothetical protein
MELADPSPHANEGEERREKPGGIERLLAWFTALLAHIGVSPLFTFSSLVTAICSVIVATYQFEIADLGKQRSESRATYEGTLSEMQNKLEERIPERVRSPLPIFPKNEISRLLDPNKKKIDLELEWVDRDRKHRHKYLVQVVCIAKVSNDQRSESPEIKRDTKPSCVPHKLDTDTPDQMKLDGETFLLTQPGVDSVKVPITATGTYAWRVARGDIDNGDIAIFEEWSPYFIFTVFESIESRVEVMNEVLVGVVEGSVLEQKIDGGREENNLVKIEEHLVDLIQSKHFKKHLKYIEEQKNKQMHYLRYPTYEALVEGVAKGEVDYAIGEITRAKYREQRGVFFTRGYYDALPIFISKSDRVGPPGEGAIVGVITGSINERALILLKKSKRFTIVGESLLQDLQRDLQGGILDFIYTSDEHAKHQLKLNDSNGPYEFVSGGTLYWELRDFYKDELGYSPLYAIATANDKLCGDLDKIVEEKVPERRSQDEFLNRIYTIYREERKAFGNPSLYLRVLEQLNPLSIFFPNAESSCVKR